MSLTPGARLGPYEILSALGAGGMGEVYRARDTKLGRDVALKILPNAFATDPERLARFQREAQLLASLNHPHIAQIYGFEDSTGIHALVMELIEGPTLTDRIARGPIPVDEALPIAKQIAEALEAAHERGIIHRDLKPANIKVREDGTVKVLDFGLAKAFEPTAWSTSPDESPTRLLRDTQAGMIIGTVGYMAPEQARGKAVDKRTDIWAFGCVLYEMLAGRRAFGGDTTADVLAALLEREPDWTVLPTSTPTSIVRLLKRCVVKDVKRRLHDIADARIEIEESEPNTEAPVTSAFSRSAWLAWSVAIASVLVVAGVMAIHLVEPALPPAPEMRVQVIMPSMSEADDVALSPDGQSLVAVASDNGPPRLWLRALDQIGPRLLEGTEGATFPFWSADSRSIGFFKSSKLYRLDIGGGRPQALTDVPDGRGGTWSADGTIVFARIALGPLMRIAATGGEATAVTTLDPPRQVGHQFPKFLPDGHHFLFYVRGAPDASGIYLGALDGGVPKRLTASDRSGAYVRPGWLVFLQQGALVARLFNLSRAELSGDPVKLADAVGQFSVSARWSGKK